jgi:hypothetical protein
MKPTTATAMALRMAPGHQLELAHLHAGAELAAALEHLAGAGAQGRSERHQHVEEQRDPADRREHRGGLVQRLRRQVEALLQPLAEGAARRHDGHEHVVGELEQHVEGRGHDAAPGELRGQEARQRHVAQRHQHPDRDHQHADQRHQQADPHRPLGQPGFGRVGAQRLQQVEHHADQRGEHQRREHVRGHHGRKARVDQRIDFGRRPGQRRHQRDQPGQGGKARGHGVGNRRQPPRRPARGQQRAAQPDDEGHEHQRLRRRLQRLARLRLPGGVFLEHFDETVRGHRDQQHMARHDGDHQQRAAQPPGRQQAHAAIRASACSAAQLPSTASSSGNQGGEHLRAASRAAVPVRRPSSSEATMVLQAVQVVGPGFLQVAPELARQRRGRALGELRLEQRRRWLTRSVPRWRTSIGQQARQPDVGVERVALLGQARALARDVGVFGGAGGRRVAEFAQACVQVGQLAGARGDELVGLRPDVVDLREQLARIVIGFGRGRELGELRAQFGHRGRRHRGDGAVGAVAGCCLAAPSRRRTSAGRRGRRSRGVGSNSWPHHRSRHVVRAGKKCSFSPQD